MPAEPENLQNAVQDGDSVFTRAAKITTNCRPLSIGTCDGHGDR
jgi:hypothetical protein